MNVLGYLILGLLLVSCSDPQVLPQPKPQTTNFDGTGSHGSSGGSSGMAWFPHADRQIRYCIFESAGGPPTELVRKSFEKGFSLVSDYYISKNAHHTLPMERRLATVLQGAECSSADLIVYPGTPDDAPGLNEFDRLALRAGRASLNNPSSFHFRTDDPTEARTWAKGYIWLAPRVAVNGQDYAWRLGPLVGVLAHEIGHIFGIPHIPGTLMAESYGRRLLELAYSEQVSDHVLFESYLQIDGSAELLVCEYWRCPLQNYHGTLGGTPARARNVFERITGREPSGSISARLYVRRFPGVDDANGLPRKSILWAGSVADDLDSHRIFLEVDHHPLVVKTGLEIFRNLWSFDPISFEGMSYQARLHTFARERIPVQIQRNHSFPDGKGHRLQVSDWDGNVFFLAHNYDSLLTADSAARPDLKIASVAQGNNTHIEVKVTNLGTKTAWASNLIARRHRKWVGTAWIPAIKPLEVVRVLLPINGRDYTAKIPAAETPGQVMVNELAFGSEQVSVVWGDERVNLFRDQLFLPTASDFNPELRTPILVEADGWNSVLESDETNNTWLWHY